jgi:L-alanine-DL-glutamate epimerase-like enolase superfamily enzyme
MEQLMDVGLIDVAQPDCGRIGGITEARRVCRMAAERGKVIVRGLPPFLLTRVTGAGYQP